MPTETLLRNALEAMPDALLLWDAEDRVAFANLKFLELFGMLIEEVDGVRQAQLEEAFTRHGVRHDDGHWLLPLGHEVTRDSKTLPQGGRLEVFHDVTDKRSRRKQEEQVLSVATHDLRAPLANVRSYASLLLTGKMSLDPRVRRSAEVISRNADKALKLLQHYFDSLRAEMGTINLDRQPVSLVPLLEEAVASRRPLMREKDVEVIEEIPERFPQVTVDRDRVAQVFTTFLDNAITRARPRTTIEVHAEERRGDFYVAITDHGAPLPPDDERHAFDRNYQIVKERRLGLGFSMAVARATLEAHGGSAGVKTTAGGTTWFFTVPRGTVA